METENIRYVPTMNARNVPTIEMTPEALRKHRLQVEYKKHKHDIICGCIMGALVGYLLALIIAGIIALLTGNYDMLYLFIYFH